MRHMLLKANTISVVCLLVTTLGCGGGVGGKTVGGFKNDDNCADSATRNTLLEFGPLIVECNRAEQTKNTMKIEAARKPIESLVPSLVGRKMAFKVEVANIEELERLGRTVVTLGDVRNSYFGGSEFFNLGCGSYSVTLYLPSSSSYKDDDGDNGPGKKFAALCQTEYYGSVEAARKEEGSFYYSSLDAPHNFLTVGKHISESAASNLSRGDVLVIEGVVGGAVYMPGSGLDPDGGSVHIDLCGISLAE